VGAEARYLSDEGRILGLDIGLEILEQTQRQCRQLCHGTFKKWQGEESLPYQEAFDRLSISFALDGFAQEIYFFDISIRVDLTGRRENDYYGSKWQGGHGQNDRRRQSGTIYNSGSAGFSGSGFNG